MGYHKEYTLKCSGEDEAFYTALKLLKKPERVIQELVDQNYLFDGEKVRQDEIDEAVLTASREYPGILFVVQANGEDAGDMSRHYYQNGKKASYEVELRFPEFDPEDMV